MFPSNSFSDLHLKYTDKTLVIGRSSLPFGTMLYDLDDELTHEHLLIHEEQGTGARGDGDINFAGFCNTRVEIAKGVDQAGVPGSLDRSFHSEVRSIRKVRGQATGSRKLQLMTRKRIGKKDRHSKIHTAQGLRDRRIRLSVHIARKFFDLQEMLAFDKASKTIEWLLAESRYAIDELSRKNRSHSSTDSTPESTMESETREAQEEEEEGQECGGRKKRKVCQGQITCMRRDLRDKARARARERTREKKMMKGLNMEDSEQLLEMGNPNSAVLDGGFLGQPENCWDLDNFGAREMSSLSIIEKFLGFTSLTDKPDDFYEMIGGDAFVEGNVQEFACSDSSMFMASYGGSQGNPTLFSLNIPGLDQPIHPGSVLESTPNCQDQ